RRPRRTSRPGCRRAGAGRGWFPARGGSSIVELGLSPFDEGANALAAVLRVDGGPVGAELRLPPVDRALGGADRHRRVARDLLRERGGFLQRPPGLDQPCDEP